MVAAALPLFLRRARGSQKIALYSGVYLLLSIFVLSNDFFISYVELPFFLFLFYLASPKVKRTLDSVGRKKGAALARVLGLVEG